MCRINYITYACLEYCDTGTQTKREHCDIFLAMKEPKDNKCSDKNGGKSTFQLLQLKQRCRACVSKAVAAKVAERKEREEREKDAERRGERGEVLRQLRLEEDEDQGLTPKVSQNPFAGAGVSSVEGTPKLLVESQGDLGLGIYF
ncbi:hypothetical protein SBOR_3966 [Sclerotinia borealis F-4128]|uniref:Uncharacterized protein n=1 Tax=Sclerotinia borealis (strain F-4128) TaxID=1432307 RepID=W9CMB1_SCLBF|nr:hypothetical protein SBOR_3966 [Sclerotinia borealis F-4128]